ncbi:TRAP transporter small permease [uncultured Dysosmobacter sp.]|uniref:TRAP transporter small permease n=1 Tax=uncultured Dysosmobacter sp. TaxID=2591384 RepID=UPI0026055BEB|nr:TRAP transporter small permease subunit [uncultured Dysosmobacter sp.]
MKKILRIIDKITKWESMLLGAVFLALTLIVFTQIVLRTTKTGNLVWLDELCRVIMVDTTFVGACVALTRGELTSLNLVTDLLSEKKRNMLAVVTNIIGGIFSIWLGTRGWTAMVGMIEQNVRTVSLGVPYWVTYLPIAIALFGMGGRFFLLTYVSFLRAFRPDNDLLEGRME